MRKEKGILQNETGLHARPASELAKLAGRFKCDINLSVNEKKAKELVKQGITVLTDDGQIYQIK